VNFLITCVTSITYRGFHQAVGSCWAVAPHACAPAGYYGPDWFADGVFIGAGPWFHGADDFRGNVDNRFHPEHGYRGPMPQRGERANAGRRVTGSNFHGNEMRDGRGHVR